MYCRSMPEALNSGTSESFPSNLGHTMEYFLSGWIACCLGGLVNREGKRRTKKTPKNTTKKSKNSLFHLNQGGNPVRMSKMLWNDVNASRLACHGLIKVYLKYCSMFCFRKHPYYILFCTKYIIAIILSCADSICMVDWKKKRKKRLSLKVLVLKCVIWMSATTN